MSRLRRRLGDERGFTLVELLVTMIIGLIVLGTLTAVVNIADRGSARVTSRIDATQRARPVIQRVMDQLHSSCVARNAVPIQAGSGDDAISFVHYTGSAASPTPVRKEIVFTPPSGSTPGTLTERTYLSTGGAAPTWTFSSTPSQTRALLRGVSRTSSSTPIFSYYAYSGGQVSSTPLATPLTSGTAASAVQVTMRMTVEPMSNGAEYANAAVPITESALLTLSPAAESATEANAPCA